MIKKLIKYDKKNNRLIIRGNRTQSIAKRELSAISDHSVQGILKIKIIRDIAPVELHINTHGLITFSDYLQHVVVTKKLFLWLIRELIKIIKATDSMRFNVRSLLYDIDFVFIEQCSQEISLTYIPLQPCELDGNIQGLLSQFINKATFDSSEDIEYIKRFLEIIKTSNFSMYNVEEFLSSIECETNPNDDKELLLCCPNCKSRVFANASRCDYCGYIISNNELIDKNNNKQMQTSILINEDSSGIVTVFRAPAQQEYGLLCKQTNHIVMIDKSPFRIGKLLDSSDLRIENEAVSRKHADIIQELDKFYIIDLYSKNGTYINGKRINSGVKEEIYENDVITFANSSFIFVKKGEH